MSVTVGITNTEHLNSVVARLKKNQGCRQRDEKLSLKAFSLRGGRCPEGGG